MPLSLITTSAGEKCFMVKQKTIYRVLFRIYFQILLKFLSIMPLLKKNLEKK